MHADDAVHHLGDPEVDLQARLGRARRAATRPYSRPDQLEHRVQGADRGLVERPRRRPNVIQPVGACGPAASSRASSLRRKVSSARSIGHSIAVPATSPSPWAAWPSPHENSAPSTSIGRYSVEPLDELAAVEVPAADARRDRRVASPGAAGAMPMTPRNGRSGTVVAELVATGHRRRVELVRVDDAVADDAQALVPRGVQPPARHAAPRRRGRARRSRSAAPSRAGAADRDRAGQRVPVVLAVLQLAPRAVGAARVGLESPAGVQRPEDHGVAGVDRQRGREVAREVSVPVCLSSEWITRGILAAMEAVILCGVQGSGKTTLYRDRFLETHARISMDLLRTRPARRRSCGVPRHEDAVRGRQHEPDRGRPGALRRAGARGRVQARRLPRRGRPRGRRRPQRRARSGPCPRPACATSPDGSSGPRPRRASTSSCTPPPRPTAAGASSRCSPHRRCSERVVDRGDRVGASFTSAAATFSRTCSGRVAPTITAVTFALVQHPCQRELGQRDARLVGHRPQRLDGGQRVVLQPLLDEPVHRLVRRPRVGRHLLARLVLAGQHALCERRPDDLA